MSEYHPKEKLLIEVESTSNGVIIGSQNRAHLVNAGKSRLEILASELPLFMGQVEEEKAEVERVKKLFQRERDNLKGTDDKDTQFKLEKHAIAESPAKRFRKDNFRDPKPFASVSVVQTLGRLETAEDIQAKREAEAKADRESAKTERESQNAMLLQAIAALTGQSQNKDSEIESLKAQIEELKNLIKKK